MATRPFRRAHGVDTKNCEAGQQPQDSLSAGCCPHPTAEPATWNA